jgi:hypothetical protein
VNLLNQRGDPKTSLYESCWHFASFIGFHYNLLHKHRSCCWTVHSNFWRKTICLVWIALVTIPETSYQIPSYYGDVQNWFSGWLLLKTYCIYCNNLCSAVWVQSNTYNDKMPRVVSFMCQNIWEYVSTVIQIYGIGSLKFGVCLVNFLYIIKLFK